MRRCTKIPYPSQAAALVALQRLRGTGVVRAYRCPREDCRCWHLTSQFHSGSSSANLAAALGVSPESLTRKSRPSPGLAIALARLTGQSVDSVLGRDGLLSVKGGYS